MFLSAGLLPESHPSSYLKAKLRVYKILGSIGVRETENFHQNEQTVPASA